MLGDDCAILTVYNINRKYFVSVATKGLVLDG